MPQSAGLSQGGGGASALAPPVFGRSVNPISTTGAHYPHPVLQAPRIFRPCDGPELRNGFLRKSLLEQKTSLMMQMKLCPSQIETKFSIHLTYI